MAYEIEIVLVQDPKPGLDELRFPGSVVYSTGDVDGSFIYRDTWILDDLTTIFADAKNDVIPVPEPLIAVNCGSKGLRGSRNSDINVGK